MLFCENCNNFMDITTTVSSEKEGQSGGSSNDEISSSDNEISTSDNKTSKMTNSDNFQQILENIDNHVSQKGFNIDDLSKNPLFQKLSKNQKTLIINQYLDKLPKSIKNTKTNKEDNASLKEDNASLKEVFIYCKSCGYHIILSERTHLYGNANNNLSNNLKFKNYKNDKTLPNSKNYNC